MGTSIGGVQVVNGGQVKWALLGSILVGGPVYAYFQGVISLVRLVGGGIQAALDGLRGFTSSFVGGVFSGISGSIGSAWQSFFVDATFAGPLTFFVTVAATMLTLVIVAWGVSRGW